MKILIAEDEPVSCRVLKANLEIWGHEVVVTVNGLDALAALQEEDAPMLAILDWMMPEMDGVQVCRQIRSATHECPLYIILLTSLNRKEDIVQGLAAGADDYLTKPFDRHELRLRVQAGVRVVELQNSLRERVRELEDAIVERMAAEETLHTLTLTDHMTGLYNYRGFYNLAEHHVKRSRRSRAKSLLIYADMDGLKKINDTLGHQVGSQAIVAVADILRKTFRDCDIVARLGGDEFAVLVPNVPTPAHSRRIIERLRNNLKAFNDPGQHPFELSLSIGAVEIDHNYDFGLEDTIARADAAMYKDKRHRKAQLAEKVV